MRAIAVLLVLFSHAKISLFEGGFIGVDIFFVISGFLITSLLKKEFELNNTISLQNFYTRRIKRLVPALFLMITCVSVASYYLLFPTNLKLFASSALSAITATSNIFFANISGGYWGKDISTMPLSHVWSLSVEEQFYIVWPVFLICFFKNIPKQFQNIALALTFTLFLALSIYFSQFPSGYYMLASRTFELLTGALISLNQSLLGNYLKKAPSLLISLLGLGIILNSVRYLSPSTTFPGWNAFWPCLGTSLLLLDSRQNFVKSLLETRLAVFIGRISYSLYLWHWPIFVLGFSLELFSRVERIGMILLSLFLATLSYYLVEQPCRYSRSTVKSIFYKMYLVPSTVIIILAVTTYLTNGFSARFSPEELQTINAVSDRTSKRFPVCSSTARFTTGLPQENSPLCYWGTTDTSDVDLLLIGDSHAEALRGFIEVLSADAKISGLQITRPTIAYLPETIFYDSKGNEEPYKSEHNQVIKNKIKNSKAKYIVIAARYSGYTLGGNKIKHNSLKNQKWNLDIQRSSLKKALKSFVDEIVALGKTPVIIKTIPETGQDFSRSSILATIYDLPLGKIEKKVIDKTHTIDRAIIDEISAMYGDVKVIDPTSLFCPDTNCYTYIDNTPLYLDNNHLNYTGSKKLGYAYLQKYNNPFK